MRHVVIFQDESGFFNAEVPSLPGCFSQGETYNEALINIGEAIQLWIDDAVEHGEEIPNDYALIQIATV